MRKSSDNRIRQLLGANLCVRKRPERVIQTFTERFTQTEYSSPQSVKQVKTNESTVHAFDEDLYCHEEELSQSQEQRTGQVAVALVSRAEYALGPYVAQYKSAEFNTRTRAIIMSRILENCKTLKLGSAHSAIDLLDRFLEKQTKKTITQQQLRLMSLACIFVAAKSREDPPALESLLDVSTLRISKQQLFAAERHLITTLNWSLNGISLQDYLEDAIIKYQKHFNIASDNHLVLKELNQLYLAIDTVALDHEHLRYENNLLVYALINLYLKPNANLFDKLLQAQQISIKSLRSVSQYLTPFVTVITQLSANKAVINALEVLKLLDISP